MSSSLPFYCRSFLWIHLWFNCVFMCKYASSSFVLFGPRYLDIMVSEGLEITQPALDPDLSTDIHHRITIRNKMAKVHRWFCLSIFFKRKHLCFFWKSFYSLKTHFHYLCRRIYDNRPSMNCSDESKGPPCTGYALALCSYFIWKID